MEENEELKQDLKSAGILIEKLKKQTNPEEERKKLNKFKDTLKLLFIILCLLITFVGGSELFYAGYHAGVEAATSLISAAEAIYS